MKLLSTLTPAEITLIRDARNVQFKDLLKFTFMDLLLKKVIKIVEVDRQPHPRDQVRTYTYIETGKNFNKYNPKVHELIFINPFREEESIQILFKHYVKMAYDASDGEKNYRERIRDTEQLNTYFNKSFFIHLFRLIRLTDKGKSIQQEITTYLYKVDAEINDLLENDKEKALELLLQIGGNIFLLKNLDFELLKNLDKELVKQKKLLATNNSDTHNVTAVDWVLYTDFYEDDDWFGIDFDDDFSFQSYLDDTIDSFDSEFDASGCSSFDSGCSSCGGCSGCGGCGGCS